MSEHEGQPSPGSDPPVATPVPDPRDVLFRILESLGEILQEIRAARAEQRTFYERGGAAPSPPRAVAESVPMAAVAVTPAAEVLPARPRSVLASAVDAFPSPAQYRALADELAACISPDQEGEVLTRALQSRLPDVFAETLLLWIDDHPMQAQRLGLRPVSADPQALEPGEQPQLLVGPGTSRAGIRLGGRLVFAPILMTPCTPLAEMIGRLWQADAVPGLAWERKWALARGELAPDDALLALWDWLEGRPGDEGTRCRRALEALGLTVENQPAGADSSHFERQLLYRPMRPGPRVLRPALLLPGPRLLRRGVQRVSPPELPAPADFLSWERDAVGRELRALRTTMVRLDNDRGEREISINDADALLNRLLQRYKEAEAKGNQAQITRLFGEFVQEVLRLSPKPAEVPPAAWNERQRDFWGVVSNHYLTKLSLREERPAVASNQQSARENYYAKHAQVRPAGNFAPGAIVEVRVPALQSKCDDSILKGFLYYRSIF